jgi:HSP20 family protein
MMRRMMDDMDRLFSGYGFVHPGQFMSSLFGDDTWTSQTPQRSLGAGSSAGTSVAPQQSQSRGQHGLQRSGREAAGGLQSMQGLWSPQVELFERGNNLIIRADLPGLSRDDIDVEIEDDALVIRGERRNEFEDEQEGYYRSERSYGSFYRAIPLPDNVDASQCNATFKDGVLEVTLPKPQGTQSKTKMIDIR